MTYHSFKRHFISPDVNMSQGLTSLLDSFVLKENGKFHGSKMTLWKWLRDETSNGHTYYAFAKEAALDSIIYRLLEAMPEVLQLKFSLKHIIRNHVVMTIAMTHSAPSDIMCSQSALMMY